MEESPEKQDAFKYPYNLIFFRGLCQTIYQNPNGVISYFAFFCDAICRYNTSNSELMNCFQNLLTTYKNTLNEKWDDYFNEFPEALRTQMKEKFEI